MTVASGLAAQDLVFSGSNPVDLGGMNRSWTYGNPSLFQRRRDVHEGLWRGRRAIDCDGWH